VADRKLKIAIVGAGIGGLTLSLALRQRGLSADIFEQARELAEIGAAVALSANATRELGRLGVLDPIVAASIVDRADRTDLSGRPHRRSDRGPCNAAWRLLSGSFQRALLRNSSR
jgi:2-polyprenyl-6-methoxyphenol hydroxylase-like FAD-dependent oxidoreductase